MNYTLNQLQIFLKIVKTRSVTKASEELYLTQPAVSIQLKNFQNQFDIPLTEVIGRKLYITDFGLEIAESAEDIINQVHAINYKTLAFKGQLHGKLKLSVVSTGKYVMPYFLTHFMNENTDVELMMDVTNKKKVIEALQKNEVDFALVSVLPSIPNLESLDLLQNKLYLVGNGDKPLTNSRHLADIFEKMPIIFREKGSATRQTMESFILENNIAITKKIELTSNEAVKQALLAGLGYSIMPLIGIRNELRNGDLQIIDIPHLPIITTWRLIWLKGKKLTPVSKAFLTYLKNNKEAVIKDKFSWYESY